jgi:hypothetical protein
MKRSNSLIEYITILPMRVTGGLQGYADPRPRVPVMPITPKVQIADDSLGTLKKGALRPWRTSNWSNNVR